MQGYFTPEIPEGTQGTVFAVFDDAKKLQYVGFSKDLRNTLRTVFGRRPDKAFFYKYALVLAIGPPGSESIMSSSYQMCSFVLHVHR